MKTFNRFCKKGFIGLSSSKTSCKKFPSLVKLQQDNPDIKIVVNPKLNSLRSFSTGLINAIFLGTKGATELEVITIALHELGHIRARHRKTTIGKEKAAWNWAKKYAKENKYPFKGSIEKKALSTYYNARSVCDNILIERAKSRELPKPTLQAKEYFCSLISGGTTIDIAFNLTQTLFYEYKTDDFSSTQVSYEHTTW